MKIRDVMTRDTKLTSPDDTLRHAAQMMTACDCGVLRWPRATASSA